MTREEIRRERKKINDASVDLGRELRRLQNECKHPDLVVGQYNESYCSDCGMFE